MRLCSVALEQITCIYFAIHIGKVFVPSIRDDDGGTLFERLQIMGHLAAEEGSYTTTGIPLALMRFMMPWMLDWRKLSEPDFIVRR